MPIHGYPGNVITANPVAPTSTVATGVWTTEQQLKAVAAGNWPFTIPTQQISRSLRFNRPDSAYLNRTFSSGNRKTWTWSCWIKRSTLDVGGGDVPLFSSVGASANYDSIRFNSDSTFRIYYSGGAAYGVAISGSPVFRDVSAWYHIVVAQDTTQATESLRLRVWINGVQQTLTGIPAQNYESGFNNAVQHEIGKQYSQSEYFPGYMAEVYFIGGSSLAASSFGRNNVDTGVWEPIAYTGSYAGTNSFYLPFSDNTSTTTLGDDFSGNNNDWTLNNFSVTAGSGNDSLVDSPTSYGTDTGAGGEVRGNYCTLNPLRNYTSTNGTISNGNLQVNGSQSATNACAAGTMVLSGKIYWEFTITTVGSSPSSGVGILPITYTGSASTANGLSVGIFYLSNGDKRVTGSSSAYGATYSSGDIIGIAVDVTAETITFYKNNTSQGSISGTGVISAGVVPYIGMDDTNSPSITANFGQRAFAYTAPSGFKALCTQNLPTPTIGATSTTQANDYFNVALYTGDGANPRTVSGVGFQPDFVWFKSRSVGYYHQLFDAVRGTTKVLYSNASDAEVTNNSNGTLTAFNSDGFTLGGTSSTSDVNGSGITFVSWNWNAGGSTVTNTSGTISAQVRANTTSGFSVVTYTAPSSGAFTVGHGLGVAPAFIITKSRSNAYSWGTYHQSIGNTGRVDLNSTSGTTTTQNSAWNNTSPTSTVFSMGSDWAGSGITYVAYCFAPVAGYSAFGSYVGNGSTDGPFIYLGFRPKFVMFKSTGVQDWVILDSARDTYNVAGNYLRPNSSGAENSGSTPTTSTYEDFLSNGIKLRNNASSSGYNNTNGVTYIYAAFAESPFKYSLAR
jgi:hypothetical protein